MPAADGSLVRAVLRGECSAFAELYHRRGKLVRAICFSTTADLDAAADLTQEVFLRAYRQLAQLDPPERFACWVVGIARRVCHEWRRSQGRQRRRTQQFAAVGAARAAATIDPGSNDDSIQRLYEAIRCLPEQQQLALHTFYLQGLDAEQARGILGVSRSGFYQMLSCARQGLREALACGDVLP